jgi:hypothetical protein
LFETILSGLRRRRAKAASAGAETGFTSDRALGRPREFGQDRRAALLSSPLLSPF